MNSRQIIKSILNGSSYEAMQAIYLAHGIDKVEAAIKDCRDKDLRIPHIIMLVRAPLLSKEAQSIFNAIKSAPDYNAKKALINAYGADKLKLMVDYVERTDIDSIINPIDELITNDAETLISSIENINFSRKDKKEIIKAYGSNKVEESIKILSKNKSYTKESDMQMK